ncbi:hypothetical protein [Nonomuraea sp. NPDC049129]|uniref:hypothetical protein n=1 Tax=Nonomuraea sp. NPDC049129 TaxID=3155272 RepID=UPI0033DF9A48
MNGGVTWAASSLWLTSTPGPARSGLGKGGRDRAREGRARSAGTAATPGRRHTEAVCRKAGIEPSRTAGDLAVRRRHVRLTVGRFVLWVSHLVPLGYLYAANSLAGLTLVSALFSRPSLLAMTALTVVVGRRACTPLAPHRDHQVVTVTPESRCRKDPS